MVREKTSQVGIRMPLSLRATLEEMAAKEHRSLSNQILFLLETAIRDVRGQYPTGPVTADTPASRRDP